MRAQLRNHWGSFTPRQRKSFIVLAAILGFTLYLCLVWSADSARQRLAPAVATLRAQTQRLDSNAIEIEGLRTAAAVTTSRTDVRSLMLVQAGASGLSRALVRIDVLDTDQVRIVLGAVPFADWLALVAGLQAQYIRLDVCRIEAMSTPGLISVTATFVRPGAR